MRLGVFPVEIEAREFADVAEDAWRSAPAERLRRKPGWAAIDLGRRPDGPDEGVAAAAGRVPASVVKRGSSFTGG